MRRKPVRVGIAGYMGAGKSSCAHTLDSPNTLIIDADVQAKLLMQSDTKLQLILKTAFGESVFKDNELRYGELGRKAFYSLSALMTLNNIVHPPLVKHLEHLLRACGKPLCILDAALIPQWRVESWFDLCVWVDVPFEIRFGRLKAKKPDIEDAELRRRMRLQEEAMSVPDEKRWVRLPDSDCGKYIRSQIKEQTTDIWNGSGHGC